MSADKTIIAGEHLAAWQFRCSDGIEVFPKMVVWGVDEDGTYRFAFRCPCGELHMPTIRQVVKLMEREWSAKSLDGHIGVAVW